MNGDLTRLDEDALKTFLLNAIRNMDSRPHEAEEALIAILSEMAGRWKANSKGKHPLSAIGYNVQWKEWRAKERRILVEWLLVSRLPTELEQYFGPPGSRERAAYMFRSIRNWKKLYGRCPDMEQAVSRWQADLDRIEAWAKAQAFR